MACSKLFSGEVPEVSSCIIQNLRNNINTLYSLSLVNRFWCRLAIPLLWEDPFSIKCRKNLTSHFLDTYFLFLNDNDKSKVNKIKPFKFDSNLQKPLFNYPSLIKTLSDERLEIHVTNWLTSVPKVSKYSRLLSLVRPQRPQHKRIENFLPLIYTQSVTDTVVYFEYEKLKVIYISLFKIFIENNASLNNLYMTCDRGSFNTWFEFGDINDMILDNPKFISEIKSFSFEYNMRSRQQDLKPTVQKLLSSLSLLFTSIKHIEFACCEGFEKGLANIIQSHSQLSSIVFNFLMVYPLLLNGLKYSSNTLTSINFNYCRFDDNMKFDAISYLTHLESLQLGSISSPRFGLLSITQPLLSITTPLKIKTLIITENLTRSINDKLLQLLKLLIQKIGSYIEILVLKIHENEPRKELFDTVIYSCEKIKFLHLCHIDKNEEI